MEEVAVISEGTSNLVTVYDEILTRSEAATVDTEAVVTTSVVLGNDLSFENLTPNIATLNQATRRLTRVSDGTASVIAISNGLRKRVNPLMYRSIGVTADTHTDFVVGSLAKHIKDAVMGMVNGKVAGDATQLRTVDGVANPSLFTNPLDLSCLPIDISDGSWVQGCLISPRHVLVAKHVGSAASRSFRRTDGSIVTRNVSAVTLPVPSSVDNLIETLESDVEGVSPARVLPENYVTKFKPQGNPSPSGYTPKNVPLIKCNRNGGLRVGLAVGGEGVSVGSPRPSWMEPWFVEWFGGSSGSPCGYPINGMFTFIGNAWMGSGYNDDAISCLNPDRVAIANLLAITGHSLTYADLSGFPTY